MGMWNIKYPYVNDEVLNLDWIIAHFNEFIEAIDSLQDWREEHEEQYEELLKMYDEVKTDWDNFVNGIWPESYYNHMKAWWEANAIDLVGSLVKFVFFGLTLDGFFVAYIPESWEDVNFDTIIDPDSEYYGHLCILY